MVENRQGLYDLQILGNSYLAEGADARQGGSSEPALVFVSHDDNGNGLPDDKWYELAGSEYGKTGTWSNYTVTYHITPQDHLKFVQIKISLINDIFLYFKFFKIKS